MKHVVVGGTGRIGSQVVERLAAGGHEVVPAAPSTGVDIRTGKGLDEVLDGAEVVIDVANAPAFDKTALDFFRTATEKLLAAGERAGVKHHIVLSIVGTDRVPQLDYYRAKARQEQMVTWGPTPFSVIRATQVFEFVEQVLSWTTDGDIVRLPGTRLQPMAAADIAEAIAAVSTRAPLQGIREIGGPEILGLDDLGRIMLAARPEDNRFVVTDDSAGMFAAVPDEVLLPGSDAQMGATHYREWLRHRATHRRNSVAGT